MYFYRFWRCVLGFFGRRLHRLEAEGLENLPQTGRAILASTHTHAIDPMLHAYLIKRDMHFMAKRELFKNKLFSGILGKLGAIPVDRGHINRSSVMSTKAVLENGGLLLIFPEGTRSKSGELGVFKSGAATFALQTGSPIIPSAIIAPEGVGFFKKVKIIYGKALSPAELGETPATSATVRAATARLRERIAKLAAEGEAE
ncbi:MAG: lysophospholipid acyltransferase family protein [Oscillospiraceae bacterium]|nr:lysophospholipid acyltransferase family protein [Oscillospiraceae bacterium]